VKKRKNYKSYRGVAPKLKSVCDLKTAEDRFWEKVSKGPACWEWQASIDNTGYGRFNEQNNSFPAHRASWEFTNGKIIGGLWVLHKCDNRKCVRPDHLFLGTPLENVIDMTTKKRHYVGPKPWKSAITTADVHRIRALRNEGFEYKDISSTLKLGFGSVCGVLQKKTWLHVGEKYGRP